MNCPPPLISSVNIPRIIWYQTDNTVVIRILLSDVPDYYLRVENNLLFFSTVTGGEKYALCLNLYGPVEAEKTLHKNFEREIKIYLTKELKWYPWLRLSTIKEKNPHITRDPDHLYEIDYSAQEDFRCDFINNKNYNNASYKRCISEDQYIKPVESSTDEEDSDDDGKLYFDFS